MALFYYTVPFIAILSVVVFFHELGHFLVGRWCGAKVDAFSLGFGPELYHYIDRRGTRWRLALLPLGGYVKFHGDANAASVPDGQAIAEMAPDERAGSLASLSVWRRTAIVAAGPLANFVLAIVLLAGLFHFYGVAAVHPRIQAIASNSAAAGSDLKIGDMLVSIGGEAIDKGTDTPKLIHSPITMVVERDGASRTIIVDPTQKFGKDASSKSVPLGITAGIRPQIVEVSAGSAAAKADLRAKDVVLSIDGRAIEAVEQLPKIIQSSTGPVKLVVKRDGTLQTIEATPRHNVIRTPAGERSSVTIGVKIEPAAENIAMHRLGPMEAVTAGGERVWSIIATTAYTIKRLVIGEESVKQLSGPIGIAQVSGEVAQMGIAPVISLTAILSVSIGLLNLLPIPLLDGGFLLFFAYEAVRGKALPERAQLVGFRIGLTFVAVLSIFVAFNDIGKIIVGQGLQPPHQQTGAGSKPK